MGPLAGAGFLQKLVPHLPIPQTRVYLLSDSWFPRSVKDFAKGMFRSHGPKRWLGDIQSFCQLTEVNDFCAPCNTFHKNLRFVQEYSGDRFTSIITAVINYSAARFAGKRIGLLATNSTVTSGLYDPTAFAERSMSLILPPKDVQEQVQAGIYAAKAGKSTAARVHFIRAVDHMRDIERAEVIILGCTEIPLYVSDRTARIPCIDTAEVLALTMASICSWAVSAAPLDMHTDAGEGGATLDSSEDKDNTSGETGTRLSGP